MPYEPKVGQFLLSPSASSSDVSDFVKEEFHNANIDQSPSTSSVSTIGCDNRDVNRVVEKFDDASGDQFLSQSSVATSCYDKSSVKDKSDNKSDNAHKDHSLSASTSADIELVKAICEDAHIDSSLSMWSSDQR